MFWGNAYGNPRIHDEPIEPSRKGDRSTAMGKLVFKGEHAENEHWEVVVI